MAQPDQSQQHALAAQVQVMRSARQFPVVGIGASAGGLEALREFFRHTAADSGAAYVVVMHLSPVHESDADAELQRATDMPVMVVDRPLHVEQNTVYIISPSRILEMNDGYLRLLEREAGGPPVAIDQFMRTLALAHGPLAAAVILSGTGVDGAGSLSLVKDQGGVVLVQDPEEALHAGMPRAAIDSGVADFVLPVAQMPAKLGDLWRNARDIELPPGATDGAKVASADLDPDYLLRDILVLLHGRTGHDFRQYKQATVLRRIERRLQVREVHTLHAYRDLLRDDAAESHALLADMLIGVTQFFRDPEAFDVLAREVVPQLFRDRDAEDLVRVWSLGCSTGQETYTLAMLLAEHAESANVGYQFQLFGSDIDARAIAAARAGVYPPSIADDVGAARLARHFTREDGRYRIRKTLRETILFANHNVLRDPPFSRLDLICCRNLLIYLNREAHAQLLEMFHFALKPGGYLFLGGSESAETLADYFVPVDKKYRVYRARPAPRFGRARGTIPMAVAAVPRPPAANAATLGKVGFSYAAVHQRLLADYAPPSALIDLDANIVHLSEGTQQFLHYAAGEPSRNLVTLAEPELRLELRAALLQAVQTGKSVETRRVALQRGDRLFYVNIVVRPVFDVNASADFMLVLFHKAEQTTDGQVPTTDGQVQEAVLSGLEQELHRTRAQLQDTIEHSETSNEELRASNEELQAMNEELRSATEELETSKEELQSVNEELATVNYELKNKVEEAGKINDDLQNLIASTDIATIFVDRSRRIKRYTPHAATLFNLIPGDVGRPLRDITHQLDYPDLAADATDSFESLRVVEREVSSEDGRWFISRILPYRTGQDRIDGAVLTFIDISSRRRAEEQMRRNEERMRLVAASTRDYAIMTLDRDGRITSFNSGAERMFGYAEQDILGRDDSIIFTPEDRAAGVPDDEKRRAREEGRAEDERWHLRQDGTRFFCSGVMTPLADGAFVGYAKIGRDLTGRVQHEQRRAEQLALERDRRAEAQTANALKDEFLAVMSHELKHPLNLIHLNADLICRMAASQDNLVLGKAAETIRASTVSQAKIINDLLDLSRLKTGKMAINRRPIDLNVMTRSIVDMVRADPAATNVRIDYSEPDEPLRLYADQTRIEQVIWNLLNNAIKFTPAGGTIEVVLERDGQWARLDVRDNSQGIAAEFLPTIFDMFGQGSPSIVRGTKGLGIGLAMVRQIVELHNGSVQAASHGSGHGASFTVRLPLDGRQQVRELPASQAGASALDGVRVLLVDDSEDVMEAFSQLLGFTGAAVSGTTSPQRALELLASDDFDLLISDIGMPEMDGLAFIDAVRTGARNAAVPAIAVTGYGRKADIERALAAGFDSHVNKPVEIDQVEAVARRLLGRSEPG
ncbi:chemotaxis protein [Duganella sp. Leaf126]|uniref:CheR family methyltransferase n=1 Tax=Duganella sp. Leaf126 TaxID=1736266 RepID=UPI0006F1FD07|nr:CheR family methyltransferase [Duganella sp. Leaf126]KQQ36229.1 chemotaxis protein [Duganella sp. Leaf126]